MSSVVLTSVDNLIFLPKKLFSETANPIVPPSEPYPAPKEISPVGFSLTSISRTLVFIFVPSLISAFTNAKMFNDLKLLIDFAFNNSLNGSPSSISSEFLITFSWVILFPVIFILST